jgi:sigma-B regulation protein RsbU (phosphoserine phosphatase)
MELNGDRFFTAWYGVYNKKTRELVYSSGGHPPALLVDKVFHVSPLKTEGFVIGGMADPTYLELKVTIPEGSVLYIFSDGVFELETVKGKVQTLPDFIEDIGAGGHHPTVEEIYQRANSINIKESFDDDFSIVRLAFL